MSENDIEKQIRYLALMRIFEQHITNFCSVYSDSLAEAQDLMQEFYANMWEKIDQLRPESTLAQQTGGFTACWSPPSCVTCATTPSTAVCHSPLPLVCPPTTTTPPSCLTTSCRSSLPPTAG